MAARAAQCGDPDRTNVMMQLPGLLAGAFLIERFFSIPGIGREVILAVERSDFPGDQGGHRLRRDRHHGRQPARRPHLPRARPAGAAQMNSLVARLGSASARPRGRVARRGARFHRVQLASASGWIARDWSSEVP
jgi:hypothetical protein